MDYATQKYIGHHQPARKAKTKATAQAVSHIRRMDAAHQRCSRNSERQTQVGADRHAANGFLKTTFLPRLKTGKSLQAATGCDKIEADFYASLLQLAKHYGFEPMETKHYGYPSNIALAFWDAKKQLERTDNYDNLILVKDYTQTYLIVEERCRTGAALYYIPVLPLHLMMRDPKRKKAAQLLLSVCSYLYHIVNIPYYTRRESYLYWHYEMHVDWIEQDDENEERTENLRELKQARKIGNSIERSLYNLTSLNEFEKRLNAFAPTDTFEQECLKVAAEAFALYTAYPSESIFRNAAKVQEDDNDYCETNTITMNQYISFTADSKGWLYESLTESVNNEFNECGEVQEPCVSKKFKGTCIEGDDLDFESRIFPLLADLCDVMDNYKF